MVRVSRICDMCVPFLCRGRGASCTRVDSHELPLELSWSTDCVRCKAVYKTGYGESDTDCVPGTDCV